MLTDAACAMIPETLFHGAGTICATGNGEAGRLEVSCPCATTLGATIVSHFVNCLTGPSAGKASRCVCPDADSDNDVDLYDYAAFQRGS
ncbi:MAG: hypothetical protein IH987_22585, partial [Planctomycetes bacterium]|nr:hypothetical protein [Planctomycetota bacterium]